MFVESVVPEITRQADVLGIRTQVIDVFPKVISFETILEVFWQTHDPTTLNRQGADYGTQYRSVIYYHDDNQKAIAEEVIAAINPSFDNKIVTELSPLDVFYPAEAYHQDYYNQNSFAGYCSAVITPKINKLRKMYSDRLKDNV